MQNTETLKEMQNTETLEEEQREEEVREVSDPGISRAAVSNRAEAVSRTERGEQS